MVVVKQVGQNFDGETPLAFEKMIWKTNDLRSGGTLELPMQNICLFAVGLPPTLRPHLRRVRPRPLPARCADSAPEAFSRDSARSPLPDGHPRERARIYKHGRVNCVLPSCMHG